MRTITFENEQTYSGNKAVSSVHLVDALLSPTVEMVLDSGAEISLLNRQFIEPLDLSVTSGQPIELMVANGDVAPAWIHAVEVDFFGRRLTIQAAICPEWDTPNLLGMRGFFDQMVVAFDHVQRRIYF